AVGAGACLVQILIYALIVKWIMRTSLPRAGAIWLISILPSVLAVVFVFVALKPFVIEAFTIASNSMAPSLVGWNQTGACAHCAKTMIFTGIPPGGPPIEFLPQQRPTGICTSCLQFGHARDISAKVENPDRMICNKLLTPRRWDLVVFRYPR